MCAPARELISMTTAIRAAWKLMHGSVPSLFRLDFSEP
jgi:hypothetical protein